MEDYEKKYKEALATAKDCLKDGTITSTAIDYISTIFPELVESEDEKIRKALIKGVESCKASGWTNFGNNVDIDVVLAWLEKQGEQKPIMNVPTREVILSIWDLGNEWKELTNGSISTEYGTQLDYIQKHWYESEYYLREKQGEQKPADKVGPKFKVGDWITFYGSTPFKIIKIGREQNGKLDYLLLDTSGHDSYYNKQYVDKNARLWGIKDAKNGDVLVDVYGNIGICEQCYDFDWVSYCSLGCNGGFQHFKIEHENEKTYPATKKQRDTLMKAMAEAGWEFDFEKKELKNIENEIEIPFGAKDSELQEATYYIPKGFYAEIDDDKVVIKKGEKPATWSDEDEKMFRGLSNALARISSNTRTDSTSVNYTFFAEIDWLKSLKDRIGE